VISRPSSPRPELVELRIADPAERWEALGFTVEDSHADVGGVRLRFGAPGTGIAGWTIRGIEPTSEIDGLPTAVEPEASGPRARQRRATGQLPPTSEHPNQAAAIDHVVVTTPDFDRTAVALEAAGMPLRRIRETPRLRQGFRRLGPAILELVELPEAPDGPARFWGLVAIVPDLPALQERLGDRLGTARDAVQPGRRIATVQDVAGLGLAVAFMTPEPAEPGEPRDHRASPTAEATRSRLDTLDP
jgi:hypothetical protein